MEKMMEKLFRWLTLRVKLNLGRENPLKNCYHRLVCRMSVGDILLTIIDVGRTGSPWVVADGLYKKGYSKTYKQCSSEVSAPSSCLGFL